MKDKHGKEITVKSKLRDDDGVEYIVIQGNFDKSSYETGAGEDLVADAGFKKSLLWQERAKEFEVLNP